MKRLLVIAITLLFAAGALGAPDAGAQTAKGAGTTASGAAEPADVPKPTGAAKPADAGKPTGAAKPAATGKPADGTKPAAKTGTEKGKDKKAEKNGKAKHEAKRESSGKAEDGAGDEKARGLDRADQAAGEHGKEGRAKARAKQGR